MRDLTAGLPRSYEVFVKGRIKFRVGRIVYLAFSRDETLMGFAFPKEECEAALETYPHQFLRPEPSDMRYQWLVVRLEVIDKEELRELVFTPGAWSCRRSSLCSPTMSSGNKEWPSEPARRSRARCPIGAARVAH